jgi:hypothetical protein
MLIDPVNKRMSYRSPKREEHVVILQACYEWI